MSRRRAGAGAGALRGVLGLIEPVYTGIVATRNRLFDRGLKAVAHLDRPVISVGNITTGGTGKTPVVCWLATALRSMGHRPAVLLRGYKSANGRSDEAAMLDGLLNRSDGLTKVIVEPNPSRLVAGRRVLREFPETDTFLLDDGFQHRQLRRNFDLVLIHAAEPFGYGHVLPRGLLREPLSGLSRASAFLLTHVSQATPEALVEIESTLRRYSPAPIYHCDHVHVGLIGPDGPVALDYLNNHRYFAFAGIGHPESLAYSLPDAARVGERWFADHHDFTSTDLNAVMEEAKKHQAVALVTTEKDWVKLEDLHETRTGGLPIMRLQLGLKFRNGDEGRLLQQVVDTLKSGGGKP